MPIPDEANIECQYQELGYGSLVCKAANINIGNQYSTNETSEEVCYRCEAGKIYRELGCEFISPRLIISQLANGEYAMHVISLFCLRRKRKTTYEYCCSCTLVRSEFTREHLDTTIGLFKASQFLTAWDNLENAKKRLIGGDPDGCITLAISSLESTMKTILDRQGQSYPRDETITSLWKVIKQTLHLGDEMSEPYLQQVIGSITGAIAGLGGLRNSLSDAHGKGLISAEIYESYAEIALNLSGSISTFLIRRLEEISGGS